MAKEKFEKIIYHSCIFFVNMLILRQEIKKYGGKRERWQKLNSREVNHT